MCDVYPLDLCDVILGQPYMWKSHIVYESRPHSVIITMGGHIYMILEVVLIQVDIGGHPPTPLARKTIFHLDSFWNFFGFQISGAVLRP
jgi:hypothetical protein